MQHCGANTTQYAEDERFPCNDVATAERLFDQHHLFLMMCFLNKAQGLSWSNTPIYQRFRRRFPVGSMELEGVPTLTYV